MRKLLLAAAASVAAVTNAHALLVLGPDTATEGLVYTLESQATADPLTEQFALVINGENTVGDAIGGRTGINAIAFNLVSQHPDSPSSGVMVGTIINGVLTQPNPAYQFQTGGINSSGCNTSGNFFCFDNINIPPIPNAPLITGPVVLGFEVTLAPGGSWANYQTALKIDWVGPAQNNYSLVSEDIPVNTVCPNCIINPTIVDAPEPATMAVLGVGLAGLLVARRRRA